MIVNLYVIFNFGLQRNGELELFRGTDCFQKSEIDFFLVKIEAAIHENLVFTKKSNAIVFHITYKNLRCSHEDITAYR